MEVRHKRHNKTDRETQSPVTKVFKEIMKREQADPEKANLLKEKHSNKKRRQYNGSRSKSDHHIISQNSSTERQKPNMQSKMAVNEQRTKTIVQNVSGPHIPFQGDQKESWWFWSQDSQKKQSEDTRSCVSCALKKLISSEYTCMVCLGVILLLFAAFAFCLICRPDTIMKKTDQFDVKSPSELNSELMKRKLEMLTGRGDGDARLTANGGASWSDVVSRGFGGLAGYVNSGYGGEYSGESNFLDSSLKPEGELSSFLDAEQIHKGLNNEKLRNFYKKLLQTDAQIRNLKKNYNDAYQMKLDDKFNFLTDRKKRSPNKEERKASPRFNSNNGYFGIEDFLNIAQLNAEENETNISNMTETQNTLKEPTSWMVEKHQLLVTYKPNEQIRKVPKCSHTPNESKSHEKQLTHPFYKHTQRVDDLLDHMLDRKLPEIMANAFGYENLLKNSKEKFDNNTDNKSIKIDSFADDIHFDNDPSKKLSEPFNTMREFDESIFKKFTNVKYIRPSTTTSYLNQKLIDPSIAAPEYKNEIKPTMEVLYQGNLRKLLQVNEENKGEISYEDLNKEEDELEIPDEETNEREKRMDNYIKDTKMGMKPRMAKYHNQNWKGPMPLYPDELISIVNQAAIQNYNFADNRDRITDYKDIAKVDNKESNLNDMEYIENYADNKFGKLAGMAQAYSDYGVLGEKKYDVRTEKNQVMDDKFKHKMPQLSIKKRKFPNFNRLKKGTTSEGIRLEVRPTTSSREDNNVSLHILKSLSKHVRLGKKNNLPVENSHTESRPDTSIENAPEMSSEKFTLFSSVHKNVKPVNEIPEKKAKEDDNSFPLGIISRKSRSLLSVQGDDYETNVAELTRIKKSKDTKNVVNNLNNTVDISVKPLNSCELSKKENKTSDLNLSNFFMLISDWFSALAASAFQSNSTNILSNVTNVTQTNSNEVIKTSKGKSTIDIVYPNYDSDMIENIGHRSRVLMSIDEEMKETSSNKQTGSSIDITKQAVVVTASPNDTIANAEEYVATLATVSTTYTNRSIIKRNAMDSIKSINWNGIYDDEYGVKLDPIDTAAGDKQFIKNLNFMKKSRNWIQEKVKNIAYNIRGKEKSTAARSKSTKSSKNPRSATVLPFIFKRLQKRNTEKSQEPTEEGTDDFKALTAKMKTVCKEAAAAVQQTRNIKELPPDLRSFLVWLTSDNADENKLAVRNNDFNLNVAFPSNIDIQQDSRTDCLGTLHAVEELMHEYDGLNDEDKSKMTGVKEYLENQLQYLHRQFSSEAGYKPLSPYQDANMRFRRDTPDKVERSHDKERKKILRDKRTFQKGYEMKHTRTTAEIYEGLSTETNRNANTAGGSRKNRSANKARYSNHNEETRHDVDIKHVEGRGTKNKSSKKNDDDDGFVNTHIIRIVK